MLPFIYYTHAAEQVRFPKVQFLILMAGIYFGIHISRKINIALGCSVIALAFFGYRSTLIYPATEILSLAAAFGSCFWVSGLKKNELQIGFKLLEFAGLLSAFYAGLQYFGHDPLFILFDWADKSRPAAILGQSTLYGPFAVACLSAALFERHYISAVLLFLPIAAINSSFTFFAFGIVIAIYIFHRIGPLTLLGIPLCMAAFFSLQAIKPHVTEELLDNNGRFALWKITAQIASHRPALGYGLGSFRQVFPMFQSKEIRAASGLKDEGLTEETKGLFKDAADLDAHFGRFVSAHNEFLQLFFETGLVGCIFALWLLLTFWIHWLALPSTSENWCLLAIFAAFMGNSIGNFPLHLIPQALLPLWAYVAVTTQKGEARMDACPIP